ncbi:hypothetical protein BDP55DRAFT_630530 [Colletotrichum godetiae]|uniref:Uncharacterized protein n=1 Tax=Colletotrichum godetiae TaxID=1209918 RepID=A0AAJ0AN99_9PEZI|nr:uncharacterized protein BDP55DRAFT_630530 [Colletotrichum godetiae]KAK1687333.1 hypothetical protein BDP55DRAFT_630530 [Colletotrichum godetiae]
MYIHSMSSFDHSREQLLPVIFSINFASRRKSTQLVVPRESLDRALLISTPVYSAEVHVIRPPGSDRTPIIIAPLPARHFENVADAYDLAVIPSKALLVAVGKLVNGEDFILVCNHPAGVRLGIFRRGDASEDRTEDRTFCLLIFIFADLQMNFDVVDIDMEDCETSKCQELLRAKVSM